MQNKTCTTIFTVCSICYLPKAIVLARSVVKFENKKLIIFIADRKQNIDLKNVPAEIRWIEEQNVEGFERIAFMYDVTEFTTAIKPLLTLKLLENSENVIFLDPDICLYDNLNVIYELLEKHSIILTPHYTIPIDDKTVGYDLGLMRFGSFNLGFYAVTKRGEALEFLKWWSLRCLNMCFFETQFGLSTDQKWVSLIPCFFKDFHVSFNLGLNMAFWNLHERILSRTEEGYIVNNRFKLVFFHFSSFDILNPRSVSSRPHPWKRTGRPDLDEICLEYAELLRQNDNGFSSIKYGFDYMSDGSYISPTLRRAYVAVNEGIPPETDPFNADGIVMKFARKNGLLQRGNIPYKSAGVSDMADHSGKFRVVYFFLKILLRILGPNNFYNLSRLFVFLSSYRQNRGLWKL